MGYSGVNDRMVPAAVAYQRKPFFLKKVFALIFFSSISILSYSQGYRSFRDEREDIVKTAVYKIGPFRVYPSLGVKDFGYDNNVYYESENQGPVSDYTLTIFSSVRLYYLFHRNVIISLRENPEYVHYFEVKRERGWNNILSPEIRILLLKRFVLSGSYLDSKIRYRVTSEFNARVYENRRGFKGSLFFETPRGTSLGLSGSSEEITYDDIRSSLQDVSISRSLNRKEQEVNLESYYRILPESFVFFKGGYKEYNFIDSLYRWRDAYSYQAYSGIQFPILGRIRGALALGYKKLTPRDANKQKFAGLIGDTSLNLRVSRFAFRVGFIRDCYFSLSSNNIYFVENRYEAGISFYLTKFLRLDYDFGTARDGYPEIDRIVSPNGQIEEIKRRDSYQTHTAGFVIRIIKNTGVGLAINYWKRESNIFLENRDRIFFGGYLTYEF